MQLAEHLSFGAYLWRLVVVILLVLANAFFVAAEFALVGARRSKIDQMANQGDRLAKAAKADQRVIIGEEVRLDGTAADWSRLDAAYYAPFRRQCAAAPFFVSAVTPAN